ncbi:AAA domain-containing protein [Paenibacillus cellulosilyticus]|uniref:AAA domain-containing protein n=1 Tax=Paenibacillus cellulosilyticus TaxID=375489 RepID=A0A2V2YLM1_9BACL|nr:AAA family ATPase [Paenibacillus cellulosilyticus]PWV94515.1 AAA domain-containing protein [Paenibacillus cellulosilyticus]QKS45023.1 AAA family ATPase [Paenibacillus cellulosilyticus]
MKLVILFGPQAVGKMTVGQELERITPLKLFHNHMTIELVSPFFSYSTAPGKRLVRQFRQAIFEEVAKSDLPGLIFTFVWALDLEDDWNYIREIRELFESNGAETFFVELEANVEERLVRNRSPHRLAHKPTKRDITFSENDLVKTMEKHRLNSFEGEFDLENYIRINNSNLSPEQVAVIVKERFQL